MSALHRRIRRRPLRWPPGGIATYETDRIYREISYLALNFGWSRRDLLDLEHAERRRYVDMVTTLVASP